MLASNMNTSNNSPFGDEHEVAPPQYQPPQYEEPRDRHALPPSIEAKNRRHTTGSPSRPSAPAMPTMHRRATVDEVIAQEASPPPSIREGDVESLPSVVATCIEMEMAEVDDVNEGEHSPLFRMPNYGVFGGELVRVKAREVVPEQNDEEARKKREGGRKRKASQRMSQTFETVVGIGRNWKRRMSSLWSKEGGDKRKDSRYVNLDGEEHEQAAARMMPGTAVDGGDDEGSRRNSVGELKSTPNNPYPGAPWFLAQHLRKQRRSRRTSAHWTPVSHDARSTAALIDFDMSQQAVAHSFLGGDGSGVAAMTSMDSRRFLTALEVGASGAIESDDEDEGTRTPTAARPQGSSLADSTCNLSDHLSRAMHLGRFDPDRVSRRFDREGPEAEQEQQQSPFDDDAVLVETPRANDNGGDVDDEDNNTTIGPEDFHSCHEILSPSGEQQRPKRWFSWLRGSRSSQPQEPRPSVANTQEPDQGQYSGFGTQFAQVAGVVGPSTYQSYPFML